MNIKYLVFLVIVTIVLGSCENLKSPAVTAISTPQCDTTAVSYSTFIVPLVKKNGCDNVGCHAGAIDEAADSVKLDDYQFVRDVALSGRLYGSLAHDSANYSAMPLGKPKITDCDLAKVKSWIHQGAKNN